MERKLKYCFQWIKSRCNNINNVRYKQYWWRWIQCLWLSYTEFKKDMRETFTKHYNMFWSRNTTIERIDTNWNYCKENCKWVTWIEQRYNTTRTRLYEGIPLKKYCNINWISYSKILARINYLWWSIDEAVKWRDICKKMYKWVIQKDLNGDFIKEYKSISEAHRITWVWLGGISQCLSWKYKQAWWYIWLYTNKQS